MNANGDLKADRDQLSLRPLGAADRGGPTFNIQYPTEQVNNRGTATGRLDSHGGTETTEEQPNVFLFLILLGVPVPL